MATQNNTQAIKNAKKLLFSKIEKKTIEEFFKEFAAAKKRKKAENHKYYTGNSTYAHCQAAANYCRRSVVDKYDLSFLQETDLKNLDADLGYFFDKKAIMGSANYINYVNGFFPESVVGKKAKYSQKMIDANKKNLGFTFPEQVSNMEMKIDDFKLLDNVITPPLSDGISSTNNHTRTCIGFEYDENGDKCSVLFLAFNSETIGRFGKEGVTSSIDKELNMLEESGVFSRNKIINLNKKNAKGETVMYGRTAHMGDIYQTLLEQDITKLTKGLDNDFKDKMVLSMIYEYNKSLSGNNNTIDAIDIIEMLKNKNKVYLA